MGIPHYQLQCVQNPHSAQLLPYIIRFENSLKAANNGPARHGVCFVLTRIHSFKFFGSTQQTTCAMVEVCLKHVGHMLFNFNVKNNPNVNNLEILQINNVNGATKNW